ncbi:Response regulator receiver domain-containing protein [Streptomyces harbinensis]|uniref:Response regulator receiver domain-containing protein n=1 Tax=Streptomyces harbinensis TaxID=1176198 RepID=A0A1I6VYH8_9ACTN|nr:Response regulator receiver domain-containing protein [Streptomyces harbinensis]
MAAVLRHREHYQLPGGVPYRVARRGSLGNGRTGAGARAYPGSVPGASGRVLVVDDSQVIRQLIRVNLELDGFEVMTASDGAECLEAVHRFRPHVITLDVAMPRLDGLGTVSRLRVDPRTGHIPLMLVSASAAPGEGPPAGVDAVVAKPFEPTALVREVRRLRDEGRGPTVPASSRTLAR